MKGDVGSILYGLNIVRDGGTLINVVNIDSYVGLVLGLDVVSFKYCHSLVRLSRLAQRKYTIFTLQG